MARIATGNRLQLSAGPIHYRDCGRGPALVFVHGALVDGSVWNGVVERLEGRFRCVIPTWPMGSHPEAMAPDADLAPHGQARLIVEFLEALDLRDVTLIGNDTGGAICQLVVTSQPERIARLVLTNTDAFEVFPPRAFAYMRVVPRVPGLLSLVAKELHAFPSLARLPFAFGGLARRRFGNAELRRFTGPAARNRAIRRDAGKLLRGIAPSVTLDASRKFSHFEKPVQLLWGDADPFFTVALARRLLDAFPQAELRLVPGARTFVFLDEPGLVAQGIAEFVAAGAASREGRSIA